MILKISFFALLIISVSMLIWWHRKRTLLRQSSMLDACSDLGFTSGNSDEVKNSLTAFPLEDLLRIDIQNVFTGTFNGVSVTFFDGNLTIQYTHATKTYHQTFLLWSREVGLPDFSIQPKSLRYRLDRDKTEEDIEKKYPKSFSKRFFVRTDDHEHLVNNLPSQFFQLCIERPQVSLYHHSGQVLYGERNIEADPSDLEGWLIRAMEIERAISGHPITPAA